MKIQRLYTFCKTKWRCIAFRIARFAIEVSGDVTVILPNNNGVIMYILSEERKLKSVEQIMDLNSIWRKEEHGPTLKNLVSFTVAFL